MKFWNGNAYTSEKASTSFFDTANYSDNIILLIF